MPQNDLSTGYVLEPGTAVEYATARELDVAGGNAALLAGGVSSTVVAVDGTIPLVLKQALPRLRVAAEWNADPGRSATEARALAVLHGITPARVPRLLDADAQNHVLALERAPRGWVDWRTALLAGPVEADVERGRIAGETLGRWHAATWDDPVLRSDFDEPDAFEQLRVDPFYREIVRRGAASTMQIQPLIDEVTGIGRCLVHGDYSPKNVLVGTGGELWIIDGEVAHFGAPVFDLAFLLAHLMLKAVHLPDRSAVLARAGGGFLDAYSAANPARVDSSRVAAHAAAVLLARVDGKSPAGYLTPAEAGQVRRIAQTSLRDGDPSMPALWEAVMGSATGAVQ